MLTLITGGAMSHKDRILRDGIKNAAENGRKVIVLVPDQFSFEYDKMLYNIFGARLFNSISVMGINRLAEEKLKKYGAKNGSAADENTKLIMMYKALKAVKASGNVLYFARNLDKPAFASEMLETVAEFRRSGVTPEILEKTASELDGTLSSKLYDLARIFDAYDKFLAEKNLCDGLSLVSEAVEAAKEYKIFSGAEIFIDRYDTFSADEFALIEVMLGQCENMTVSLTLSDENNSRSNLSPFSATLKTKSALEAIAASVGVKTEYKKSSQYYYNKAALEHINANIFCLTNHPSANSEGVKVVFAQDCYDEVEYCAAEIKRLVNEEKLSYGEIAVISRQLGEYAPIIEGTFERYEIPSFIDIKEPISRSVLAIYISSVLDCVRGKSFKTEKILRMIKLPLSPFKDFEVSAVEEYCFCWGVDGDMWKEPFRAFGDKNSNLETLNSIREKIVKPISDFRERAKDCTAAEMTVYFTDLLNDFNLTSCANAIAKLSLSMEDEKSFITEKTASLELVREFKQIWLMFMEGMRSIYENIGEKSISLKEFSELLELLMSGMSVSYPPQRINTVTVASAEHSRLSAVKSVFVLGVNADKLPASVSAKGLFSEREKKLLEEKGVPFSTTSMTRIYNERLTAYLAVTQGSDKLYVCCPKADAKGKGLVPSQIIGEFVRMFGNGIVVEVSELGVDFYCRTPRAAFSKLSECLNDRTTQSETLRKALLSVEGVKDKVERMIDNSKDKPFELSDETARKLFFKNSDGKYSICLSPSSIDKYNKCPFDYFCNYGLGLRVPLKNEMNGINRGNMLHHILENIISKDGENGKVYNVDFEKLSEDEIKSLVYRLADEYKETAMGGDFGKNMRFNAAFARIRENAVSVVRNIQQELSFSNFKPCAFEYSITDENGEAMLKIENSDVVINVRGKIDRVDSYTDEKGRTFLKIVDYKTGKIDNLFRNIFHGVSLQLIIYLMAMLEGKSDVAGKDVFPGGIVYTPAGFITSSGNLNNNKPIPDGEEEYRLKIAAKFNDDYVRDKLARYGFSVEDDEVINALNVTGDKKFYPSKSDNVIDIEKFEAMETHAKSKIEMVGNGLFNGRISAEPLADATSERLRKPCSYCAYGAVCGVKNSKPKNLILKEDSEKFNGVLSALAAVSNDKNGKGGGK